MFKDFLIRLVEKLLRGDLTPEQRNRLVVHILDIEGALPIHAIVTSDDEGVLVNGEQLNYDNASVLRNSATQVLDNRAFKLCADHVRFIAFKHGLATGLLPSEILFYRASVWYADQLKAHLALLAQREPFQQLGS
jgi:hypothetical protein